MEKENKVVGLGFYQTSDSFKNLDKLNQKKNEDLKKLNEKISDVKNDLLNPNLSYEDRKRLKKELSDLEYRYNLKKSDFNIDTIGFAFQDENEHIIENVKRVLSTRRGERIGNLAFGSDVSKYIFLPEMTIDDLIQEVVNSLARCEPRVEVVECSLAATEWDTVKINLVIRVKKTNEILETDLEI